MKRISSIILSAVLSILPAQACEFHGYIPDPTLVDILLGTEQAVIARPDPGHPSRYQITEALIGPAEISIPLPVSAEMHAALDPGETVLLAREEAYGPWLELAVLDDSYRALVGEVIARQNDWLYGGDDARFQMFAGLINHANPDIRLLALRELDRADYNLLRSLDIPALATLREDVRDVDDELRPIRILLAGLSGDQSYGDLITAGLARGVAMDLGYLGAYATALIELQGPRAVKTIVDEHFDVDLSRDTSERLLEAFAIKSQSATGMTQRAIQQGVGQVLTASPELAGPAARQFGLRGDWSIAEHIEEAINAHTPKREEDAMALAQYLEISRSVGTLR